MITKNLNRVFMPININITQKNILIVGGGKVAYHKIVLIMRFTNRIRVVAKEIIPEIKKLDIFCIEKAYEPYDLDGNFLVYAATNIPETNLQIYNDAHERNILANVVDNPPVCDFVSPAIYIKDHMTVAVGSNARDVYKSIELRDKIKEFIENNPGIEI